MKNNLGGIKITGPINLDAYITAVELSEILGVRTNRFRPWYNWYYSNEYTKPKDFPVLPNFVIYGNKRYWKKSDIPQLKKFKKSLGQGKNGVMGEYNARQWQDRGRTALESKGRTDLVERYFTK